MWLAGKRLREALAGEVLLRTDFRVPRLATADLSGRRVEDVVSRGKHLLTRIEGGWTLHTHFRMDGSWHLYRPGRRWAGGPVSDVRVVLGTGAWEAVGYRLPVVELLRTDEEHRAVGHLGPDLLGPDWDLEEAVRRVAAEPEVAVGAALLDQRKVAGIGTLYRAEALFLTGVHPRRPVGEVRDLGRVLVRARALLLANRERAAQVTTGDVRRGRQHWVFDREGQPCRRCGTRVRREDFGPAGQERRSFWCPRCQPE